MKAVNISVTAVPVDHTLAEYLIECSECGPVEAVKHADVDHHCLLHLEAHEVDTTPFREDQ